MKIKPRHKLSGLIALGIISACLPGQASDPLNESINDLLEEGIYLQEVKSDYGSAIDAYESIVANEETTRKISAEALFRLAICYYEEGNTSKGQEELAKLVEAYPEQSKWVKRAQELLPKDFVPQITPWVDGEQIEYVWRLPTGRVIGHSFYTYRQFEKGDRSLWKADQRMFLMGDRFTSVEFDAETFETVYSEMHSMQTGRVRSWFEPEGVRVDYERTHADQLYEQSGAVYDNEQALIMMRQFPAEVGFSTTKPIFVNFTGITMEVVFEIGAIETVTTPMGEMECYRVDLEVGGTKQAVHITNDEHRYPIQMQVGGVTGQAVAVDMIQPNTTRDYIDEEVGITMTHPSDWNLILAIESATKPGSQLTILDPAAHGVFNFFALSNSILSPNEFGNPERIAENILWDVSSQVENYDFLESSQEILTINGMQAYLCEAKFSQDGKDMVYILIIAMNDSDHFAFHGRVSKEMYPGLGYAYRKIAESLRIVR